eukprot:g79756.t1
MASRRLVATAFRGSMRSQTAGLRSSGLLAVDAGAVNANSVRGVCKQSFRLASQQSSMLRPLSALTNTPMLGKLSSLSTPGPLDEITVDDEDDGRTNRDR